MESDEFQSLSDSEAPYHPAGGLTPPGPEPSFPPHSRTPPKASTPPDPSIPRCSSTPPGPSIPPELPASSVPAPTTHTPWGTCLDHAKQNAREEVKVWKDEMKSLLTFATLFSGVAGAFSIDSYHKADQEDAATTTVLLLKSILALQLNATHPQPQTNIPINLDPKILITASAKRINIYNFLSLILSLSVVMAGIMCLQWLREYDQDPTGIPRPRREHLGIRCMRNEGLEKWHVFTVLKTLPLILLLSLFLFFAGIIELLLGIDRTAAIVVSVMVGIAAMFMVVTTAAPTLLTFYVRWADHHRSSQCPWKSGQAWVFYQLFGAPVHFIASLISTLRGQTPSDDTEDFFKLWNWSVYDWLVYRRSDIANVGFGIHWLGKMQFQNKGVAEALYECIKEKSAHDSLREVLMEKDARRAHSIQRAPNWKPLKMKDTDLEADQARAAHIADVTVFQTLAHLAEKVERGYSSDILLEQRLDLFCKIIETDRDKDIDCPLIGYMNQRVLNSPEVRQRLLRCIFSLMEDNNAGINETHITTVNDILDFEAIAQNPNLQLFEEAAAALTSWITYHSFDQDEGADKGSSQQAGRSLSRKVLELDNHVFRLRGFVAKRNYMSLVASRNFYH